MANTSLPWLGKMRRTFFIIPIHHNHHRPSIGYIMNFGNQKMLVLDCVFEIKKIVSGLLMRKRLKMGIQCGTSGGGLSSLKLKFLSYTV